jgi:predicted kinase
VRANEEELRRRLHARQAGGADPSEADTAVLEYQLATQEPLQESELPQAWVVDTTAASPEETAERLAAHP